MDNKVLNREHFTGERALYGAHDLTITNSVFDDGESPLKHAHDLVIEGCSFRWKYPFWYAKNIEVRNSVLAEMARSGLWYGENLSFEDTMIEAPKEFRRCKGVTLRNVTMPNALETLWTCDNVRLQNVVAKGDYFGKDSSDVKIDGLQLYGNYCFDGGKNIEVHNAKLLSKDSFWNTENVTIYDSYICGEYFGWNSKNVKLVNCTVESLQGFDYIENLVLENCTLLNTTLAFEYSSVTAKINGRIDSILNPKEGRIVADEVGTLIINEEKVDPAKTSVTLTDGTKVAPVREDEVVLVSGQGKETELVRKGE